MRILLRHLRIPYQLTLSPIFLWGWVLSGRRVELALLSPLLTLQLLLYPGITAFNSFYDRDEGPIGGLQHPPRVVPALLPAAIMLKACALACGFAMSTALGSVCTLFVLLSILYSHPRTRWKASAMLSLLVVGPGQGGLGFLAGWTAARGELASAMTLQGFSGAIVAVLAVLGFYPLTQLFQVEEDRARGDRTVALILGQRRAVQFAQICSAAAASVSACVAARKGLALDALVLACGYLALAAAVDPIAKAPHSALFRYVLRLQCIAAALFAAYLLARSAAWR